jgi:predicted nucleic-acid-binding protein
MGRSTFVISLDTNILVRIIVEDDPVQQRQAAVLLESSAFVSATVVLETAWVLRSIYGLPRPAVANALMGVIDAPNIVVVDETAIRWALERHADAVSDLADLLHIATSAGTERFMTFDQKLVGQAGTETPVPIEAII